MSNLPPIPANLPRDPTMTFRNLRAVALSRADDGSEMFHLQLSDAVLLDEPTLEKFVPSSSPARELLGPAGSDLGESSELTLPSEVGRINPGSVRPLSPEKTPVAPQRREYAFADSLRKVELLGEGGYGEVWASEQLRLRRRIAVKRIREDIRAMPCSARAWEAFCERYFRHEAYIAAQLDHPNIVPVHDLEQEPDGSPAILMKLVQGRPWSEILCEDLLSMTPEELLARHLPIFHSVVQAVAFAHSRAIVHRDIKPSQVMVGDYGEVLLMDWGLALSCDPKALGDFWKPDFTPLPPTVDQAATPAGTPSYMAPEQTRDDMSLLGPWTDVFLLGSTLYLLLTGRLPYESPTVEETFTKAAKGEWKPLAEAGAGRDIPPELADLVAAAMQPDYRKRRITARMMLERLDAFRSGATWRSESEQLCRQVGAQLSRGEVDYHAFEVMGNLLGKARELWPANPRVPELAEAVTLGYCRAALANADLRLARVQSELLEPSKDRERVREKIVQAEQARARRERQRRVATTAAGVLLVCAVVAAGLAFAAMRTAEQKRQLAELATRKAITNESEARRLGDKAAREQYFASIGYASASLVDHDVIKAAALLGSVAPSLRGWEWHYLDNLTHAETQRFDTKEPLLACAIAPDDRTLALAGEDGLVHLVDRTTDERRALAGHAMKIYGLAFSPDGERLASASKDKTVRLWDVQTGECLRVITGHSDFVNSVCFHPTDPKLLLSASSDHTARLWDVASGAELHAVRPGELVRTATFDATGDRYVMATRNRRLLIVRTADGHVLEDYDMRESFASGLTSAEFSPDGKLLGLSCWDSAAAIVDAQTGAVLHLLREHTDATYRARFTRDGRQLITFGHDGVAIVWDVATGERRFALEGHGGAIWDGALTPGGDAVLTAAYDRTARLWKLADFDPFPRVFDESVPLFDPTVAAMDVPLFFRNDTTYIRVDDYWEAPQGGRIVEARGLRLRILPGVSVWSRDGAGRVVIGRKAAIKYTAGTRPDFVLSDEAVVSAAVRRDGTMVVATRRELIVVDPGLSNIVTRLAADDDEPPYYHIDFASQSDHLVCVHDRDNNVELHVWDAAADDPREWNIVLEHSGAYGDVDAVEVAPNGKWLAFGTLASWQVVFLDIPTGRQLGVGEGHSDRIMALRVSPNGQRLASIAWDGTLRVLEVGTGREFLFVRPDSGSKFFAGDWTPDGGLIVAPASSGRVFMLDGRKGD